MTHQEYKYEGALFYASPKNRVAVCPDHTRLIQRCVGTRHGVARFEAFSCPSDITFWRLLHARYGVPMEQVMELTGGKLGILPLRSKR